MKYQTNKELGIVINKYGCFLNSILEKVEKSTEWEKHFSNSDVVKIYQYCISKSWITKEVWENKILKDGCTVLDAKSIYNYAAEFLNSPSRCTSYKMADNMYVPVINEEEILCLGRTDYNGFHFVAGTGIVSAPWQKEIEFDPIEGGSLCAKSGFIIDKRILTITKNEQI